MDDDDLRDFFAGLAMLGLLASGERGEAVGSYAYSYADDMIAKRNKINSVTQKFVIYLRRKTGTTGGVFGIGDYAAYIIFPNNFL